MGSGGGAVKRLTLDTFDVPFAKSAAVDETQGIAFRDFTRADRTRRQIIEAIQSIEALHDLETYMEAEAPVIDALGAFSPEMQASIAQAAQDQAAFINPDRLKPRAADPAQVKHGKTTMNAKKFSPFHKLMFNDVTLLYPRLDQTYRFNNAQKKSEACDPKVQGAQWTCTMEVTKAVAAEIKRQCFDHYNECRKHDNKLAEVDFADFRVFGSKVKTGEDGKPVKNDAGDVLVHFRAKKNGTNGKGEMNKAPLVFDADMTPLDNLGIWSGSVGNVRVLAYPVIDPDGVCGISLLLDVIQVTEAVYGGDGIEDDFAPVNKPTLADYETETPAERPADVDDELAF
jgi:hypothetical protein